MIYNKEFPKLKYEETTGLFYWTVSPRYNVKEGAIAGSDEQGYIRIVYNKKKYLAHRLAWYFKHNSWPKQHIDHINGNKKDNRIINLRDVSRSENLQNNYKVRTGKKLLGVSYAKRYNRYVAITRLRGKKIHLGTFKTEQEAHEAYLKYRVVEI